MRHVLVKVAPGAKTVPSGMVTSRTNCAWSQTGVGGAARVAVGRASVGKLAAEVLVGAGGGMVGVLNGVTCVVEKVDMACTVSAAAVNTALGSSVAGLLVGRLQAARIKMIMNRIEAKRIILDILFSSIDESHFNTPCASFGVAMTCGAHPACLSRHPMVGAGSRNTDGILRFFVPVSHPPRGL